MKSVAIILWCATVASAQVPAGFRPIFDGRSLNGWHLSRTDHHGSTPETSVANGVLSLRESPYGQGGLLLSDGRYSDFELYLEVKAPWGCNSGIFLRSTEGGAAYQIELDQGRGTGNLLGENLHVSLPAEARQLSTVWKAGEWNSFRIRMEGAAPHLTEWVNGIKMWEVEEPRNDQIAGATDGMIGLQVHWSSLYQPAKDSFNLPGSWKPGVAYQFRNIALKRLTPATYRNDVGMEFVLIQPGQMQEAVYQPTCPSESDPAVAGEAGSALDKRILWTAADLALCRSLVQQETSPGFPVKITKAFYIGKYEVMQGEWARVMGTNPSVFQGAAVQDEAARHPVDSVTWEAAQAFVAKLNALERTHAYRLPTEFEWEYAGRAGGSGQAGWDTIRKQAVQGLRTGADGRTPTTMIVGSKEPNAWGLYDMLGNVWEWVEDFYNGKTFPDPVAPRAGTEHVLKGAGFVSDVKNATYATHGAGPGDGWDVGFRVVKDLE